MSAVTAEAAWYALGERVMRALQRPRPPCTRDEEAARTLSCARTGESGSNAAPAAARPRRPASGKRAVAHEEASWAEPICCASGRPLKQERPCTAAAKVPAARLRAGHATGGGH